MPGPIEPVTCEARAPVPYSGPAVIPSQDTATPGPYTWNNVVIKGGGFVSGIITSPALPGLMYARTDVGGAYRSDPSNPSGRRWRPLTDWAGRNDENLTGIESIAADPVDPNRVYIAAGQYLNGGNGQILSSTDMGRTWTRNNIGAPMGGNVNGRSMGERLAIDPNLPSTIYFGSRTAGLWKSTDSAQTWTAVSGFPMTGAGSCGTVDSSCGVTFVVFDPRSGSPGSPTPTIYVGDGVTTATALYRSTDAGATWEPVDNQPAGMMPHHAVLDGCGNLYLAYNDWAGPNDVKAGAVWRHNIASGSWTNVSPPDLPGGFGGISADVAHPGTLLVTTIDHWSPGEIFRTTDGGASWARLVSAAQRDVDGAQWLWWHTSNLPAMGWMGDVEIDPFNPSHALYITGQGIWSSDDVTAADTGAPTHWRFDNNGLEETVPLDLVSPPSGDAPLLSGLGDIAGFRHDDLTVSPPDGMFGSPIFGNTNSLDFAEAAPAIVARVGTNSQTDGARGAYSTDGGKTWTAFIRAPEPSMMTLRAREGTIAVSADGATFVWAPRDAKPSYSRDRGTSWTACAGYTSGTRVAADRVNPSRFYASSGARMYMSSDGGATFVLQNDMAPSGLPRPVFGVEGELWVTTNAGLFHSQSSGATWTPSPQVNGGVAVGFGMAAQGRTYPAVYFAGSVSGIWGIHRSDDSGATWQRIDDPEHQFGAVSCLTGDPRRYGRVYFGTDGRGILYGDPR